MSPPPLFLPLLAFHFDVFYEHVCAQRLVCESAWKPEHSLPDPRFPYLRFNQLWIQNVPERCCISADCTDFSPCHGMLACYSRAVLCLASTSCGRDDVSHTGARAQITCKRHNCLSKGLEQTLDFGILEGSRTASFRYQRTTGWLNSASRLLQCQAHVVLKKTVVECVNKRMNFCV